MSNARLASRNFVAALVTQLLSWGIAFSVALFLPSYAGVNGVGALAVASAFITIFGVLAAMGTTSVLVKEIARNRSRTGELLSAALMIRVPLSILLGSAAYALSKALNYSQDLQLFIMLAAVGLVFSTISEALGAVLRGMENLTRQGIGVLADKFLFSGLTILLIYLQQPLWTLASVGIVTAIVSCAVNLLSLRPVLPGLFRRVDFATVRSLAMASLAFVGLSAFVTLYGQSDPIILKTFANEATVGWYASAGRLIGTSLFIPTAVNAALLPTLGRLFMVDKAQFAVYVKRIITFLAVCGMPISVILVVASHRLFEILPYPDTFAGSIPVLRIGGVTVLLYYMTVGCGAIITASDRQNAMVPVFALSCLIGIPSCIAATVVSHRYFGNGAAGAVASDCLTELLILCGLLRILKDLLPTRYMIALLLRLIVAVLPMAFLLLWTTSTNRSSPWLFGLWAIVPGLAVYVAGCVLLGCVSLSETMILIRGVLSRGAARSTA